ncbi:QWRF motif-containing protein 2 [Populus alba x Populus x berolinensis]|nr:QWRF motif-containing protein 2 [Populus alba x Populus x berolinensis]
MVAAIPQAAASSTDKTPNRTRPPLLPSEKDHQQNNGSARIATRKPRGKQVPSRYLSPSPSTSTSTTTTTTTTTTTSSSSSSSSSFPRRFASPLLSRSTNSGPLHTPLTTTTCSLPSGSKRSQSVDRRRPVTSSRPTTPNPQRTATEISAATKMLITSTRSLSVSFQGEAFSLPISKAKSVTPPQNNVVRKATPERRRATPVRDQGENSRPMDQHRWPGRSREGNLKERNPLLSRSLDCSVVVGGGGDRRVIGSGFVGVKSLQQSIVDEGMRLSLDLGNARQNTDTISVNESSFTGDLTASDSDSVSSGSTSGVPEIGKRKTTRGITVSARFWQETNSRLRRLQDPGSPLSTSPGSRVGVSPKAIQSKRFSSDGPLSSPRMMAASPIRGATRPASPSKLWTTSASSPSRGMSSPSRVRSMSSSSPSILSFSVDLRRGKMGEDRIVDAHMLRLLYNRYLQWRFVNAREDATFMVQRLNAEKNLWNAWVTISELRHSVTLRRVKLLLLRQKLKLTSILKGQIAHLEEWSHLDRGHSSSLEGATEALKASTLRLPVVGKTVADVQNLKDAVGSAVDVMQAMASSICSLSSKVEDMNSLVAELVNVTAKERHMLEQCKDFLSTLATVQVKDCSVRTHILQLNRLPTTTSLTTRV